ncbi:hypothetical protein LSH36_344g00015 [Paralvinella palmiformis]|uniref:Uncharacterized protein n=1 Tax=Paralvinella palmiformis TaxID=53620 RepID=A0AAD9JEZ4_9ANNE|nr:hypothetical protein LSH36_344g00015 [Paralvinella palmiformis]
MYFLLSSLIIIWLFLELNTTSYSLLKSSPILSIILIEPLFGDNKHKSSAYPRSPSLGKVLKQALRKGNNKSNFPQSFNIENSTVSNKTEIADAFNKFFVNIGLNLSKNVPTLNLPPSMQQVIGIHTRCPMHVYIIHGMN